MKKLLISISMIGFCLSPAPAQESPCSDIKPGLKALKVMNMQPARRGKAWLEGTPGSVFTTICDAGGRKTEESESHQRSPAIKSRLTYKTSEEAKAICAGLKSEEKLTTTFSEEGRTSLDDFCRANKKKNYDAVLVHDVPAGETGEGRLIKRIFRVYNSKGVITEEHRFDSVQGLEGRTTFKYGAKNELLEKTEHDPEGGQLKRETYVFDKSVNARTVSLFDENDQLAKKTSYEYREDGTLRREIQTSYDSAEQILSRSEIHCDEKGSRQKEIVYQTDMTNPVYEYDYAYTYDKNGNWTEERRTKLLIYDDKRLEDASLAPRIIKRQLTYY